MRLSLPLLFSTVAQSVVASKSYILVFQQGEITPSLYIQLARSKVLELGGSINHEYSTVLTGFSFTLPSVETSANSINQLEKIMDPRFPFFIESDSEVHVN